MAKLNMWVGASAPISCEDNRRDPHSGRAGGITVAGPSKAHGRNRISPKAVNGYVHEHVHVNDDVCVDLDVSRAVDGLLKSGK
jgi:hypothetical protein